VIQISNTRKKILINICPNQNIKCLSKTTKLTLVTLSKYIKEMESDDLIYTRKMGISKIINLTSKGEMSQHKLISNL